jgi:protein-tyrosine phosphatase
MGNICRSPAAEGIFRKLVTEAGRSGEFEIDSAGTTGYHAGDRADSRMRSAARARGYELDSIARRIEISDFERFDLILTMDEENFREVSALDPGARARVVPIVSYCRLHRVAGVPDPYYGGPSGFGEVIDILEDACASLLQQL